MRRKCNQCETEMIEDCEINKEWNVDNIIISKKYKGFLNYKKAKLKAAVCPNCGHVSFYIDEYKQFANG